MRQIIENRGGKRLALRACMGGAALAFLFTTAATLHAQGPLFPGAVQPGGAQSGPRLYDVTSFASWQSNATPNNGLLLPYTANLGSDAVLGAGVSVGWTKRSARSNFNITYSGNYISRVVYSDWNAFNHFLSITANRHLSPRWNLTVSTSGSLSRYDQLLQTPTLFASLVAAPGTFEDLSSAVLAGKYTNDQLASLLTGSPLIESPARTLLFGNRVFDSGLRTSIEYTASPRLTVTLSGGASRVEHLADPARQDGQRYAYLLPNASTGSAAVDVSYALTPHTQVGVEMTSSRVFSRFQDAYISRVEGTLGRTIGRHWFAQLRGGGGFMNNVRSAYPFTSSVQPVVGATLGYRTYAHTLMGTYQRTVGGAYGAGIAQMNIYMAAWQWRRPGRQWGLFSNYGEEQLRRAIFANINGWRAAAGVNRRMGRHTMCEMSYSYGAFSTPSSATPFKSSMHSVTVSLTWYPSPLER